MTRGFDDSKRNIATPLVRKQNSFYGNLPESSKLEKHEVENKRPDALPKKTGSVELVQEIKGRQMKVPVILKAYISSFERYIVVSKDCCHSMERDCVFVNLRGCLIAKESGGFSITPMLMEGVSLRFRTEKGDLAHWMGVLDGDAPNTNSSRLARMNSPTESLPRSVCVKGRPLSPFCSSPVSSPASHRRSALSSLTETTEEA